MIGLRYELAVARIREMKTETTVPENYQDYFHKMADFVLLIDEIHSLIENNLYRTQDIGVLADYNHKLYEDVMPENYETSYANPAYAVFCFGEECGQILSLLYTELRGAIAYVHEGNTEYLDILFELLIGIYNQFEDGQDLASVRDMIYWYASDYSDVFSADRTMEMFDPEKDFAVDIVMNADLTDLRYLYYFGEYISDNQIRTAKHLLSLDESVIRKMADVYTEGYRIGFIQTGKDLSKKQIVDIRCELGFERMIRMAIQNFEGMHLKPVMYRSGVSVITKRGVHKIGYTGGNPNPQYDYDHKADQALFFDKKYMERRLEVTQTTLEHHKQMARGYAGPAVVETFGEEPFVPVNKPEVLKMDAKQEELSIQYSIRSSQLMNEYIHEDERSFTIIAYPLPSIGEQYEGIFDEIIRINTLDAKVYTKVQQTIIDALDQGDYVHVLGKNGNKTDLTVNLYKLHDPQKETIFENCVADVNIPVGEVFTSPVLEGTNGILNVSKVYLNGLQYKDLTITLANGMIADYNCANFERELENKEYVRENILFKHPTLPIGEFAIGTNTTAYVAAKKYGIEDKMPILIAEKMGPHFAVGDTCYSWAEDVRVFNPNGKEIVARENSVSALRKENVSKAYFNCHTDITIPYEELAHIRVLTKSGEEISIIEDGRFVLPGTEILNEPFNS